MMFTVLGSAVIGLALVVAGLFYVRAILVRRTRTVAALAWALICLGSAIFYFGIAVAGYRQWRQ